MLDQSCSRRQHQTLSGLLASRRKKPAGSGWPIAAWDDGMEAGDLWTVIAGVGDCVHEPSATAVRTGTNGLLISTRTTGAAPGDVVSLTQAIAAPGQDYVTLTAWLRNPNTVITSYAGISLWCYAGGRRYTARVHWYVGDSKWYYQNAGGGDTALSATTYTWPDNTWIMLSLQIRISTHEYGWIILPNQTIDLTGTQPYDAGVEAGSGLQAGLRIVAAAAAAATIHVDDCVLYHSPYP
jgi:hypothetical protein